MHVNDAKSVVHQSRRFRVELDRFLVMFSRIFVVFLQIIGMTKGPMSLGLFRIVFECDLKFANSVVNLPVLRKKGRVIVVHDP